MSAARFLGFRFGGAMASWGDVTVGDVRSSWAAPSASALGGLIGAALGVRRDDTEGQADLRDWRFAVRLDAPGVPMIDYHTVMAARTEARGRPFTTRRDELTRGKTGTKVTQRSYYADQVATVLAWGGDIDAAAAALRRPVSPLCLGRRACPPSSPLAPLPVEADTLADAFLAYDRDRTGPFGPRPWAKGAELFFDAVDDAMREGLTDIVSQERRDRPVTRGPDWSFAVRTMNSARRQA